ncbi:translation initiation factor SUI1-like protein [Chloropicon roscoffensis]|uniref:Translation initiation factor SUI1-like protein n=1 Tax=Chloropicon roscoffensis TaxID=1461544 RepID=A0AAX4NY27_9CHLO
MADINNADGGDEGAAEPLTPEVVEYEPVTGVPPEFCEYLPKDDFLKALPWLAENRSLEWMQANCKKYKNFDKIFESQDTLEEKLKDLSVSTSAREPEPKLLPGGKKKKKQKLEILIERSVRNKRKCITSVTGLDVFGIKLAEAAKLMGKKFASGCSVVKHPTGVSMIETQGDNQYEIAELIMKKYKDKDIKEEHFFSVVKQKKSPLF